MSQRIQRFSRILKLRENDREVEQIALAAERREEEEVLQRLDALGHEKKTALNSFSDNRDRVCSGREIWFQRQSIDVLEKRIDKGKENLSDVQNRISLTEMRLVERHRDVRMMEGYVDRLKDDERLSVIAAEQNELDDISVTRYARRVRGNTVK
ncbi:MAG: flagellar export protein FliJ [Synergistaceae bacterium]|jgi:flagellar export protein FliJ|nr:flagellar export protein FliJ [Synergistaceae bacterium]